MRFVLSDCRIYILRTLIASSVSCAGSSPASAASESPGIEWHGFLTTGVAVSDSDQDYTGNINQTPNYNQHSRFGLNLSSKISPSIDVAAQFVADKENLKPDWAFASWYPLDGVALRFGKQKFPVWLMSDRLDVGKTYPWITPPEEVYKQNPIDAITGGSVSYSFNISDFEVLTELVVGSANTQLKSEQKFNGSAITADIEVQELVAGNFVVGNEYVKLRAGGARGRVSSRTEIYALEKLDAAFWSYGLSANFKNFLLLSEYAIISAKIDEKEKKKANKDAADAVYKAGATGDGVDNAQAQKAVLNAIIHNGTLIGGKSYYVTSGYQMEDWLPHITYARIIAPANAFSYGNQYSVTTGLKFDINHSTDIKFEWQKITPEKNSWGLFIRDQLNLPEKFDPINLYKVAMDFVF